MVINQPQRFLYQMRCLNAFPQGVCNIGWMSEGGKLIGIIQLGYISGEGCDKCKALTTASKTEPSYQ